MAPLSNEPLTWLERYENGDEQAAQEIVDVYYERLVRLAQKRLAQLPPQVGDDEGAVISALRSFFSGIDAGQFSNLDTDQDLWRVLATITARKAIRQLRVHWKKSGEADRVKRDRDLLLLFSAEPTPAEEVAWVDECQQKIERLADPTLEKLAQLKLEGFSNAEIAKQLSLHLRSVQRKLKLIQSKWLESDDD